MFTYQIKGLAICYDPFFWLRFYKLLKKIHPTVIHSSLWAANFISRIMGKRLKIPTICSVHLGLDQDGIVRNVFDRFTLHYSDRIVAISKTVSDSLDQRAAWVAGKKIETIKNGIDDSNVLALNAKHRVTKTALGIPSDYFVIGSVGRFIPRKNYLQLLEAFAQVHGSFKNTRLLLVGFGPQEKLLRKKAAHLGIENAVIFVVGKPAYGYYSAMDCFVLPSLSEGLSIALLEAMSFGLACIVHNKDMKHDVIVHEFNGLLVTDNRKLRREIERIIVDSALRQELKLIAQKTVKYEHSLDRMVDSYKRLYAEVYRSAYDLPGSNTLSMP